MFEMLLDQSKSAIENVDTYLSLPENRMARAAVTRLHPSRTSTGLSGSITLVYGPTGVGKTHLAIKSLHELVRRHPRIKFVYTSVKNLCEMLQRADDRSELAEFLEELRSLDVLVCEHLDWLEEAPSFQTLFVMLIEALDEGLTQILFTSSKPVGQIRPLDQRLVSRCHGGLCASMTSPGLESRVQLFQHWFRELKLPILKPFVASARLLAERLPLSTRELRNAASALAPHNARKPCPIDVAYLERWLSKENRTPRLSFEVIVHQVAQEFGVYPSEIRSRSRLQRLAVPRQCAMWLARDLTGRPLEQIGEYFDRSHTTVSHSLSRLEEQMPSIPSLRQQVRKLRKQLKELPREDCA